MCLFTAWVGESHERSIKDTGFSTRKKEIKMAKKILFMQSQYFSWSIPSGIESLGCLTFKHSYYPHLSYTGFLERFAKTVWWCIIQTAYLLEQVWGNLLKSDSVHALSPLLLQALHELLSSSFITPAQTSFLKIPGNNCIHTHSSVTTQEDAVWWWLYSPVRLAAY